MLIYQNTTISDYFFRLTKKTVNDYVKLRRLEKAANQLKNTEKRILDIAIACGFSGHSAFTRAFKEVYKITLMIIVIKKFI